MTYVLISFGGTVFAALIAAGATWAVAARRLSGTIRSSEAADLWKESSSIRDWYSKRMSHLEDENTELRKESARRERELMEEVRKCHDRIEGLEGELKKLTAGDDLPGYMQ